MKKNLKATGIIVEYNPLHYGHIHHINETRKVSECDVLIAVMSPQFVQRGEPAIIDKWTRVEKALEAGVDLVLELPTHLTLQSAEVFAKSALKILSLVRVDTVVYGSETLEKPKLQSLDKDLMDKGYSYAHAKNIDQLKPNQILGAYYEKYAKLHKIHTKRILREVAYHDETLYQNISSASAIRKAHKKGIDTHLNTPLNLEDYEAVFIEDAYPFVRQKIITDYENLNQYLLVDEGIENLFYKNALKYESFEDFINHTTSRRYTQSRIQRTLMHILLQTPRNIEPLNSVRILGMNKIGQKYLNQIKKDAPIISSFKNYQFNKLELKSTAVYATLLKNKNPLIKKEAGSIVII